MVVGLTQACTKLGDLKLGLSVHGNLIQKDHSMDVEVQTSLWTCMPRMDILRCIDFWLCSKCFCKECT